MDDFQNVVMIKKMIALYTFHITKVYDLSYFLCIGQVLMTCCYFILLFFCI